MAQGFAEQSRVGVRASRKEAMDALKEAQKNGLPEDDFKSPIFQEYLKSLTLKQITVLPEKTL